MHKATHWSWPGQRTERKSGTCSAVSNCPTPHAPSTGSTAFQSLPRGKLQHFQAPAVRHSSCQLWGSHVHLNYRGLGRTEANRWASHGERGAVWELSSPCKLSYQGQSGWEQQCPLLGSLWDAFGTSSAAIYCLKPWTVTPVAIPQCVATTAVPRQIF